MDSHKALSRWYYVVLALLLGTHGGLLAWSATRHSPTWDEPAYLVAGWSHWKFGRFELYSVNPPLVRMVASLPLLFDRQVRMDWSEYGLHAHHRSEVALGRKFFELNGNHAQELLVWGRWLCIPFSLLGAWVCWLWARELYGPSAGLLACVLWCFSPNILGNGELITPDVPAAACGLWACWLFRRWMLNPGWERAFLAGLGLGLALCVKSTWLLLIPIYLVLAWGVGPDGSWSWRRKPTYLGHAGGMFLISLLLLNSLYGFRGTGLPLDKYLFVSRLFSGVSPITTENGTTLTPLGNRFQGSLFGKLPVPVPADFLHGIDIQKSDFERGLYDPNWKSYLGGTWQQGGWWYFYLVALFIKVPLAEICLWGLAVVAMFHRWRAGQVRVREALLLGLPVLVVFGAAGALWSFSRYFRYVLPALPFVMIWASQAALANGWSNRWWRWCPACCVAWLMVGCGLIYPHSLSYFNELAGGPNRGSYWLLDSNVDWGQDLLELRRWLEQHPAQRGELKLAYFGSIDPTCLGVSTELPPPLPVNASRAEVARHPEWGPQPGLYAVSVNALRGHSMPLPNGHGEWRYLGQPVFTYFQNFQPVDRIGNTLWIYRITKEDIARLERQQGSTEPRSLAFRQKSTPRP